MFKTCNNYGKRCQLRSPKAPTDHQFRIWIKDAVSELSLSGNNSVKLTGFDISSSGFPPEEERGKNIDFEVWDFHVPFPEKYRGKFDVVHVRLVVLALKKESIERVVGNMVGLLKPGGYLQWTDYDWQDSPLRSYPASLVADSKFVNSILSSQSFSLSVMTPVSHALRTLPMEEIKITDFIDATDGNEELQKEVAEYYYTNHLVILPRVYQRSGVAKNEEEAMRLTMEHIGRIREAQARGDHFRMPVVTLVARKKVE